MQIKIYKVHTEIFHKSGTSYHTGFQMINDYEIKLRSRMFNIIIYFEFLPI